MGRGMPADDHLPAGPHPPRAPSAEPAPRAARALVAAALVAVYGWWAVGLPPFSGTATVAVIGAGAAAAAWAGWHRRRSGSRAGGTQEARLAPWAVLTAAAVVWQLAAFVQRPRDDHPTLSSLANTALDSHAARTAAFVAWVIATVALVRR